MEVFEAIKKRRSVRFYTNEFVSEDNIKKLVEAAICAPSGHRIYARRIVIVQQENIIRGIKDVSAGLHGNPTALFILCQDEKKLKDATDSWVLSDKTLSKKVLESEIRDTVNLLSIMDIAIAAQNICLAATGLDIGSCIIGLADKNAIKKLLGLPEHIVPKLLVSMGYRDKDADLNFIRSVPKIPMSRAFDNIVVNWIKD